MDWFEVARWCGGFFASFLSGLVLAAPFLRKLAPAIRALLRRELEPMNARLKNLEAHASGSHVPLLGIPALTPLPFRSPFYVAHARDTKHRRTEDTQPPEKL